MTFAILQESWDQWIDIAVVQDVLLTHGRQTEPKNLEFLWFHFTSKCNADYFYAGLSFEFNLYGLVVSEG